MNRQVEVRPDGIRTVDVNIEESWHRYIIVPKKLLENSLKAQGFDFDTSDISGLNWKSLVLTELLPTGLIEQPYYGGPGRDFIHKASVRSTTRFFIFFQSGGLDI